MRDVDVLIVGGGPVGLTASILLSNAGVTSLLVEPSVELISALEHILGRARRSTT
jgi:2-polyprenyl-6-methoxyphenol hydroxylase-like FAD-dependent oxidoreductase